MSVIVDDQDSLVQYFPPVGWVSQGGSSEYQSTTKTSVTAGDTATFTSVTGSFMSVNGPITFGSKGEGINASAVIDGGSPLPITQADLTQAGTTTFSNHFFSSALAAGNHTMVVILLDDHPFNVDYFLPNPTQIIRRQPHSPRSHRLS
ncbi:hypothetical protein DFH09DRAFT_911806 [Mycena vulgaris]|nr:hypothetical protein DFH09DRAFT_911806 [Mycena vulgaris]